MQVKQGWERAISRVRRGERDTSVDATNIRLLYWDMIWFGLLFGVSANFLVVFVARLGAPPLAISAVTSGPAFVNILWQLQAVRVVERSADPHRLTIRAALPHRSSLLIALLPFVLPQAWQPYAIVAIVLLQGIPAAIIMVAFQAMFVEIVPRDRMAAVVGTRNALMGLMGSITVMVCGVVLTRMPFPYGYQLLFFGGFLAAMASLWCVVRLRIDRLTESRKVAKPAVRGSAWALRRDHNFVRYVAGAATLHLGMFMTAPLFPLYWVEVLGLGDGWISVFVTSLTVTSIAGAFGLRALPQRWSNSLILGVASIFFSLYPILTSFLTQPVLIAAVAAFAGIWGGVFGVVLFNALTEVCPPDQRPRYIGVYTWLMNIAMFVGPLLGAAFAESISVQNALLVAGVVRFLAGVLFLWLRFHPWTESREPALAAT